MFWVIVDDREEFAKVADARPGQKFALANGTSCVVDRVEPPPPGAHLVQGTIHAHRATG